MREVWEGMRCWKLEVDLGGGSGLGRVRVRVRAGECEGSDARERFLAPPFCVSSAMTQPSV